MALRTLGGLALEGSRLTRPKPLALLAFLAMEGPRARRELAGLFFGAATDPRDSLATALRHLRTAGALEEQSEERVASAVEADASALLRDFDAYRYQAVLERYSGSFLEGVTLDLGLELEEWLFTTREAIAARVRTAALHRARVAVGEGRFEDARALTVRALRLDGVPELEDDEIALAHHLAEQLHLPETAQLRALAGGAGLALAAPAAGAQAPVVTQSSASAGLHRSTRFVGRARELERLESLCSDPDVRLVTIVGMGGVGKTRLALRFAERALAFQRERYPDGVFVVGLEAVDHASGVPATIASGLVLPAAAAATPAGLQEALASWRSLIVLDNAEHVEGLAAWAGGLVDACPGLQLLLTSRRRLGLESEYALPLTGLATERVPGSRSEATGLFLARAARVGFDQDAASDVLDAIEALCDDLEGYPLGIELAASWTRVLGVEEIRGTVREGLDLLAEGPPDAPERHRAVRAALEPSWALVGERERIVLQRLSVFRGGFSLDAASAVAGATLPLLVRFVDDGLLRSIGGGRGRFSFHPVMQAFVREQTPPGVQASASAAHVDFYARLVASARFRVEREPRETLERVSTDAADVSAALRQALLSGQTAVAVAMAHALVVDLDVLQARPCPPELSEVLLQVVDAAEAKGLLGDAAGVLIKVANARRGVDADLRDAARLYRRALALAEACGDVHAQVMVHAILAVVGHGADADAAAHHLRIAEELAGDDAFLRCEVMQRAAYLAMVNGDLEASRQINQTAVELAERLWHEGHPNAGRLASLLFHCLHNLGGTLDRLGSIEASLPVRERALAFARERGNRLWAAHAHHDLALGLADLRRWREALMQAEAASALYHEHGASAEADAVEANLVRWRDEAAQTSR